MGILETYEAFIALSKTNPLVAGAVGLWGAGLVTWLFRSVPSKLWDLFYTQCTTTITINNASGVSAWDSNAIQFSLFSEWFHRHVIRCLSRSYTIDFLRTYDNSGREDKTNIIIGYGTHFMFYKRKLFMVRKYKLESSGTSIIKEEYLITGFTRNTTVFNTLIKEFIYTPEENAIGIKEWKGNEWSGLISIMKRPLDTVTVKKDIKDRIIQNIEFFRNNPEWYAKKGMTYKQTYLLHGEPGTGKTSFIKAIASEYNMNVYMVSLSRMSDSNIITSLLTVPKNSIVIMEDFDSSTATKKRIQNKPSAPKRKLIEDIPTEEKAAEVEDEFGLTLSGLLNALDGIAGLNGVILFLTTNHLEHIDPALLRKGRVNYIEHITLLDDEDIRKQIAVYFPEETLNTNKFAPITGADLEGLYLDHHDDFETFINMIPKEVV